MGCAERLWICWWKVLLLGGCGALGQSPGTGRVTEVLEFLNWAQLALYEGICAVYVLWVFLREVFIM